MAGGRLVPYAAPRARAMAVEGARLARLGARRGASLRPVFENEAWATGARGGGLRVFVPCTMLLTDDSNRGLF